MIYIYYGFGFEFKSNIPLIGISGNKYNYRIDSLEIYINVVIDVKWC